MAILVGLLSGVAGAAPATAAIPQSLKDSCQPRDAADGDTSNGLQMPFRLCDDGLPPTGGREPNVGAVSAVAVPQRYNGYAGLPERVLPPDPNAGADSNGDIAIDIDLSLPDPQRHPPPAGGYPLIAMMHGCCAGSKKDWEADRVDVSDERWHYSNAWFASRGYVVLTYTSRGFVNRDNRGSTGETQLDDRRYEINDFQHLAGQIADDPDLRVDPQKVVATGGSYGGGFSWMALTDPTWQSPGGKAMRLAAAAPRYAWTDLIYALIPSGTHRRDALPAFDGTDSTTPLPFPKKSILAGLYVAGTTGTPPDFAHATFPPFVTEAFLCQESTDPYELNPLCASPLQTTLPGFIAHRSAYYQNEFFARIATDPSARVPLYSAGTFTDPLFTLQEHRRMAERLRSVAPGYPVQEHYGDVQHFVQNKAKEWADICGSDHHICRLADYPNGDLNAIPPSRVRDAGTNTRLNRFVDFYVKPPGNPRERQPRFDATAALQICPQNASDAFPVDEPGERFTAPSFAALGAGNLRIEASGTQVTTSTAAPNPHAATAEPVRNGQPENRGGNAGRCPVEQSPGGAATAGPGVATYDSAPLDREHVMIGQTRVTVPHTGEGTGIQLHARLYDLYPDGRQVMVDRGVRRVASPNETTVFDLHGNGWRFPKGHRIRIELAQDDDPYIKRSTQPSTLTLSGVRLDVPVFTPAGTPPGQRPRPRRPLALRLSVRPGSTMVKRRTRFTFTVTTTSSGRRRSVAGATVRFAGSRVRTDRRGRAVMTKRLGRSGRYRARASRRGYRSAVASVRVARRSRPRFTG